MDKQFWITLIKTTLVVTLIPMGFGMLQVVLFPDDQRFEKYGDWMQWILFNSTITFLLAFSSFLIIGYLRKAVPWEKTQFGLRTALVLVAVTVPAAIIMFVFSKVACSFSTMECDTRENLFINITLAVVITVIVTIIMEGFYLFDMWKTTLLKESKLREENLKSQLEVLKSQINPHFLFNTLNSIYVQSGKNPDLARDSIMHFSELLSYQLYDSREKLVSLRNEVEYLENYIELEKMRQGDAVKLTTDFEPIPERFVVAPLLFTPLIENAFKYGLASGLDVYQLNISLRIDGKHILFSCENEYRPRTQKQKGGLGLENLRQRLALLYPERHILNIEDSGNNYAVELKIEY